MSANVLLELEEELQAEITDAELTELAKEMVKNRKRASYYQNKANENQSRLLSELGEGEMLSFLNEKGLEYTAIVNQTFVSTAWKGVAEQRHAAGEMTEDEFGELLVNQSYESQRLIRRDLSLAHRYNHDNPETHIIARRAKNPATAPKLTRETALQFVEEAMLTPVTARELALKYGVTAATIGIWKRKLKNGEQVPYLMED